MNAGITNHSGYREENQYNPVNIKQQQGNLSGVVSLFRRMKILHKLFVAGFLTLLSSLVLFSLYWVNMNTSISEALNQAEGLEYASAVNHVMMTMAQHRGLTAAYRAGHSSLELEVGKKLKEIESAMAIVGEMNKKSGELFKVSGEWIKIEQQWQAFVKSSPRLSPGRDFKRHSALISRIQRLLESIGNNARLFENKNLVNTYSASLLLIELPELFESLGKLRGKGAAFIATGRPLAIQENLLVHDLYRSAGMILQKVDRSVTAIGQEDDGEKTRLDGFIRTLNQKTDQFLMLLDWDISQTEIDGLSSKMIFSAGTKAITSASELSAALSTSLAQSLGQHVSNLRIKTYTILVIMLLLLIVSWTACAWIVHDIVQRMRLSESVFGRIAQGDYSSQIQIKGQDEVDSLLHALAKMQQRLDISISEERHKAMEMARVKVALDCVSIPVLLADDQHVVIYINEAFKTTFRDFQEDIRSQVPMFDLATLVGKSLETFRMEAFGAQALMGAVAGKVKQLEIGNLHLRYVLNPVLDDEACRIGTVIEWHNHTQQTTVENEIRQLVSEAKSGNLQLRMVLGDKEGFFKIIGQHINELIEVNDQFIGEAKQAICSMACGDLSHLIKGEYSGAFKELKEAINQTITRLGQVISSIVMTAEVVQTDALQIASGNNDLKQRTQQQADSLEESASSLEQITGTVKNYSANARDANQLSTQTQQQAQQSGETVKETIKAMNEIQASSFKIASIIGVIDEIAFQTNLLALNAAVEAAHAGDQGRGFAVVASEVRNLAQRSSEAAKQIKELIDDSGEKVEYGTTLVNRSGELLSEITKSVCKVNKRIGEISIAGDEQSIGIEMVNNSINAIDQVTQQNKELVEQTAQASNHLTEQALTLVELVSFFRNKVTHADLRKLKANMEQAA